MRRLTVLALFVLASFLPDLVAARVAHEARAYVGPDGRWTGRGEILPDDGDGPESPWRIDLDVRSGQIDVDLGGAVEPGSLHVTAGWESAWWDDDLVRHTAATGELQDAGTHLTLDAEAGRVFGPSPAMTMALGPAVRKGGCGMAREATARHVIRWRRAGRDYTLRIAVLFTRRGNRVVTVDAGAPE